MLIDDQPGPAPNLAAAVNTRRIPALDGLRGVAVLLVYLFHYGGGLRSSYKLVRALGYATEAGWIGVVLFFTLSGFLITGILWDGLSAPRSPLNPHPSLSTFLRNFYIRRAFRILPLYALAVGAAFLVGLAAGSTFIELRPILLYLGFLQDLPVLSARATTLRSPLPLYHLWSLAVEEQFYLLWPVCLLFIRSRRSALLASLWILAATIAFRFTVFGLPAFAAARANHLYDFFLLTHGGALAAGSALALAHRGPHWRTVTRWALPAVLAGTLTFLLTSWSVHSFYLTPPTQFTLGLTAVTLASAALLVLCVHPGRVAHLLSFKPLRFLGTVSYGFYVFHILLMPVFDTLGTRLTHTTAGSPYQLARFLVAFPITLAVSTLSFYFFERPLLTLARAHQTPAHLPPLQRVAGNPST